MHGPLNVKFIRYVIPRKISVTAKMEIVNPLNPELNPICYLLALLAHHFLHVSRIRVKSLPLRLLMSYIYIYIYMEHLFLMFLDHKDDAAQSV
jgi:hypothetical protein